MTDHSPEAGGRRDEFNLPRIRSSHTLSGLRSQQQQGQHAAATVASASTPPVTPGTTRSGLTVPAGTGGLKASASRDQLQQQYPQYPEVASSASSSSSSSRVHGNSHPVKASPSAAPLNPVALGLLFVAALVCLALLFRSFPELSEDDKALLKFPRSMHDVRSLSVVLRKYRDDNIGVVVAGFCAIYILSVLVLCNPRGPMARIRTPP
jgi:hypothetical protein